MTDMLTTRQWEKMQFVRCYAWGHAWDEYDNSDWRPTFGADHLVLRCIRCSTERREAYDIHGDIAQRHYHWPLGYRWGKGDAKPTKAEFRLMAVADLRSKRKRMTRPKTSRRASA